jgi:hypothetical protein
MNSVGRLLLFAILTNGATCLAQDGLKGLENYFKQYKYSVFVPARQNAAVGTIVSFKTGFDSVVSSRCLPVAKIPRSDAAPIALTDRTGTATRQFGVAGSFAQGLNPEVDLKGAFSDARVQKVTISIEDPTETHIESKDVKDYVVSLPTTDSCSRVMASKQNRILESLVQIKGINYSFYDKDGKKMNLDASLMKALKLSPQYQRSFENTDTLKIDHPMFIAYRVWKVTVLPGIAKNDVQLDESTPEEVRALQKQNTKSKSTAPTT